MVVETAATFVGGPVYIPAPYAEPDAGVLRQFIVQHPFASLITVDALGQPVVTHLPMRIEPLAEPLRLTGHMARANPHWRAIDQGRESLAIFSGPHAYVSPQWYERPDVPTWNYAVVHAHGTLAVKEDADWIERQVHGLSAEYEGRDRADTIVSQFRKHLAAIVGVELVVSRLDGKFKLSQNRSETDQLSVVAALQASARPADRECGNLMMERLRITRSTPVGRSGEDR